MVDVLEREPMINVDAMGSDRGPLEVLSGAIQAKEAGAHITLYGDEAVLAGDHGIPIVHVPDHVEMDDTNAARKVAKDRETGNLSIVRAAMDVKSGIGDAVYSCGNTAGVMGTGAFVLGIIERVEKPMISTPIPHVDLDRVLRRTFLGDSGLNPNTDLFQFFQNVLMSDVHANMSGIEFPRTLLLSNGAEKTKGSVLTKPMFKFLSKWGDDLELSFYGNGEGNDTMSGRADVLSTDGFTGNAVLKAMKGTGDQILQAMGFMDLNSEEQAAFGVLFPKMYATLNGILSSNAVGGAPAIGLEHLLLKGAGDSKAQGVKNGILQARELALGQAIGPLISRKFELVATLEDNNGEFAKDLTAIKAIK